jgi:SSS family solute:Na+ symporter
MNLVYAIISLVGYIVIELAVVLYAGSLAIHSIFGLPIACGLLILCLVRGGYTDIIQVTVLILGGLTVTLIGLHQVSQLTGHGGSVVGGFKSLLESSPDLAECVVVLYIRFF